ncbi:hypothetical protein ACH5RR_018514 [Cinchona calisaya]|uniref:Uncharacterized protein n=1 Tax=Cinchona calisaya TaxID=153742 RepID=A0ABD2ZQB4_9GENT
MGDGLDSELVPDRNRGGWPNRVAKTCNWRADQAGYSSKSRARGEQWHGRYLSKSRARGEQPRGRRWMASSVSTAW